MLPGFLGMAQNIPKTITPSFTPQKIHLYGVLDEPAWENAETSTDFVQFFPADSILTNQNQDFLHKAFV